MARGFRWLPGLLAAGACAFFCWGVVPARGDEPKESTDFYAAARNKMVERHLAERGIKDPRVLEAFRTVPITPPFDVAFMTEVLAPKPTERIYEVGTGSGYQASILSRLVRDVYSVEIHKPLSERATKLIKELGYKNVHTRVGDGYAGWPEAAPFDGIIVTCAPQSVPQPLIDQLKEGGRMVIPLGDRFNQTVWLMVKKDGKLQGKPLRPTLFVPMTGKAQQEARQRAEEKAEQKAADEAEKKADKKAEKKAGEEKKP
jgi:protein-L-isoaspartate(D-aspartate) O-methyltransferase